MRKNSGMYFFISFSLLSFFAALFVSCAQIENQKWGNDAVVIDKKYKDFAFGVDSYLETKHFRGAILVGKKGKIIYAKGYGLRDKKSKKNYENGINSVFEVGSITKQMTAAAVMQLAQQKKISLDDNISKYFFQYKYGDDITIRMLLSMRSGLTDHINASEDYFPKDVNRYIQERQLACKPINDRLVEDFFYDAPLLTKPNTTYFYCNTNYYILARIIEKVSGMPYHKYMEKNIFKKCGMDNTNQEFQKTDTRGYDYKGRYFSIPSEIAFGCGDVNSSVIDLFKWNNCLTGGKVISKKSFKKMINTQSYGFGVYRREDSMFHAGMTNVFNSYDGYYFDEKLSVIVLTNCPINEVNATLVARHIKKIFDGK